MSIEESDIQITTYITKQIRTASFHNFIVSVSFSRTVLARNYEATDPLFVRRTRGDLLSTQYPQSWYPGLSFAVY
jgi:hypothetical protein